MGRRKKFATGNVNADSLRGNAKVVVDIASSSGDRSPVESEDRVTGDATMT